MLGKNQTCIMIQLHFSPCARAIYIDGAEERSDNPQGFYLDEVEVEDVCPPRIFWVILGGEVLGERGVG